MASHPVGSAAMTTRHWAGRLSIDVAHNCACLLFSNARAKAKKPGFARFGGRPMGWVPAFRPFVQQVLSKPP